MIQIIGEHFRIIIMEHSITGLMSEVRDAIIKEQFIQEHAVLRMRLSIQILESGLHLMRDGKKCSEISTFYQ